MNLTALRPSFPLLGKELTELAARKRTYAVRVIFALILFGFFGFVLFILFQFSRGNPFAIIGRGDYLFTALVDFQFVAIYLLLPAMMAGVITSEKERDSLSLLFLTEMRPWEILAQKYLGRLIPMFSLLLLTLPLLAVAYALGGVSADAVANGFYLLVLTCLQVGAFALMVSAFCKTTAAAVVMSYVGLVVFSFGPAWSVLLLIELNWIDRFNVNFLLSHLAPYVFEETLRRPYARVLAKSLTILLTIPLLLTCTLVFLRTRATVRRRPIQWPMNVFKRMDAFWMKLNEGLPVLVKEDNSLPANEPIAWRETQKRPLGTVRYLFRILVVLESIVVMVVVWFMWIGSSSSFSNSIETISVLFFLTFALAALAVTVRSATVISHERAYETLEVLATTPLSGAEIVRQKSRGPFRLWLVFAIPLLTLLVLDAWLAVKNRQWGWVNYWQKQDNIGPLEYLAFLCSAVLIYLPTFSWMGMWFGLRSRGRSRAILASLAALVTWIGLPIVVGVMGELQREIFYGLGNEPTILFQEILYFSPATLIFGIRTHARDLLKSQTPWEALFTANLILHAALGLFFRWRCITRADRYLGRG